MNTKQMLITITVIALLVIGLGWYMSNEQQTNTGMISEPSATTTEITIPAPTTTVALPDLAGVVLEIPDENATVTITTESGTSSDSTLYSASFGDDESGFVALVDNRLTAVSDTTFVVPFAVSANGSGTFSYLGLLSSKDGELEHLSSFFLGDRIRITDVSAEDGLITVQTLDRHTDQAMSEDPEVVVLREIIISDNELLLTQEYYGTDPANMSVEVEYDSEEDILRLAGMAPKNWFFEGDFPVRISSLEGDTLHDGYVTAVGLESSEERVPYVGEIREASREEGEVWLLTLIKDNVSDDRSLDESYTLTLY